MSFAEAQAVAHKVLHMFHNGEFDVATLFFSEFKSVISQKPTALRLIPADAPGGKPADLGGAVYEAEPEEGEILADLPAAQHRRADLPWPARKRRLRTGRAHERHGQRHAQRRDMINKLSINTTASARRRSPRNSSKSFRAPRRSNRTRKD
jgi:hypothetical protein